MNDREYLQELLSLGQSELGKRMKYEIQVLGSDMVAKLDAYNQNHWLNDDLQKERAIYVAKLQQIMLIVDLLFNEETVKALLDTAVAQEKEAQNTEPTDPEEIKDLDKELVY